MKEKLGVYTAARYMPTKQALICLYAKEYGAVFSVAARGLDDVAKQMFVPYYLFPTCIRHSNGEEYDISKFWSRYESIKLEEVVTRN